MALTRRPITTALLFCACLFLLVGLIIYVGPIEIAEYDVNSAVRSIDWRNALTGFVESDYMGIGLGTESVANYYSALDRSERYTEDQALLVSVHNVFLYCFFKFGLFGGILFLLFVFVDCRPRRTQNKRLDRFTAYSFCCALATLSVNVAVESPLFYFGTIFALAGARLGHSSSPRATVAGQSQ